LRRGKREIERMRGWREKMRGEREKLRERRGTGRVHAGACIALGVSLE
jgi:hypothetical protein